MPASTDIIFEVKNGPSNSTVTAEYSGRLNGMVGKRFTINLDGSGYGSFNVNFYDSSYGNTSGIMIIVEKPSARISIQVREWSGA